MDGQERDQVRQALEEALDEVNAKLARLQEATAPVSPDNAIGRVSRMDAIGNKAINDAALSHAREEQANLEQALATVDSADFGKCEFCLQPIGLDRMLAMPGTLRCRRCAAL